VAASFIAAHRPRSDVLGEKSCGSTLTEVVHRFHYAAINDRCPAGGDTCPIEIPYNHSETEDMETLNATTHDARQDCVCTGHPSVEDATRGVLIVSNDMSDRQILGQVLASNPCPRYWISTIKEAVDWVTSNSARVVICDRNLPDGCWRELWQVLRLRPSPPIFIVSADWTDVRLWAEVLNLGAYDILVKPYRKDEVSRILRHAMGRSRALLEARSWPS
jgi:two-component system, OmpR family, response regulator CpxR